MSIRVRFAPSPTGHIHVGNARTALFNYLYAKNIGGTFILRIEDTDLERSTTESEDLIYEDLKWLGLDWDEGPSKDGGYGPYRQTERMDIYKNHTEQLLKEKKAYKCFCTKEELEAARELAAKEGRAPIYNGRCRNMSSEEAKKLETSGAPHAIRFKIDKPTALVRDILHGDINFPTNAFGDFIIVRPDGVPVYNYVVVVDDALMKITHVIRGDDHLPNTPKQVLLYHAFGYQEPLFAHIPMILGEDRAKLSKRHGNTSVEQFRSNGYLPEAMVNYMALLSWSDKGERELFTLKELTEVFSMDRVSSSAAVFDFGKLKWMNGQYIRSADLSRITDLCTGYLIDAGYINEEFAKSQKTKLMAMVGSVRDNLELLSDITPYLAVYFCDLPELDADAKELLALPTAKAVLESFKGKLLSANADCITADMYKQMAKEVQAETGAKGKALYMTIRVGVTGRTKGPELDQFIPLMSAKILADRITKIGNQI